MQTLPATLSPCGPNLGNGNCYPITAVRGAWSPSGTEYMTLVEYLVRATNYGGPPGAALYLYSLTYPNTEVSGHAILSGHVTVGR